jgi:cell division protease FtsH
MITNYGMSDRFRNVYLPSRKQSSFLGEGAYTPVREYSESTQQYIDEQTSKIIAERFDRVSALLKKNQNLLHRVAAKLREVEALERSEFEKLVSQAAPEASKAAAEARGDGHSFSRVSGAGPKDRHEEPKKCYTIQGS